MKKTEFIVTQGTQDIILKREFNASREKVFHAFIDPEIFKKWWGPRYLVNTIEKFEAKPGGIWKVIQTDQKGNRYRFYGVFHEILQDERIVQTFEFDGAPGHCALNCISFQDMGNGKTLLIEKSIFQSISDRNGMVHSGAEEGASESMDRLAEILNEFK